MPKRSYSTVSICIAILICLAPFALSSCGGANEGPGDGADDDLLKYVEFRAVSGYFNGEEYTTELPYFVDGSDNVITRQLNKSIDEFAERIRGASKDWGYMVESSCVLTDGDLVSIRLKGYYDIEHGRDGDLWAANYSAGENSASPAGSSAPSPTATSVATNDFPHSANYQAWLQRYINDLYWKSEGGNVRIYNFRVPYIYYLDDSKLTAAAMFTQLKDGGETWEKIVEIDISEGPEPYFTAAIMENIEELALEQDGLPIPVPDEGAAPAPSPGGNGPHTINDEYGILVTYWDSSADQYAYRLLAPGQMNPSFSEVFDGLKRSITFENSTANAGDYTKVYTFTDDRGYRNFVLKTQYWGEKDWTAGIERLCYVGADYIDGSMVGTIRGPGAMSEEELLIRYPHDLYLAEKINPDAHFALNMSNPSKAYIYKDPDDSGAKDLVFLVKNGTVVSMDSAESYEYSRYDQALGHSKPVSARNNRPSQLIVKTTASYKNEFDVLQVAPDYPYADEYTGNDRLIKVDLRVPQVDSGVPAATEINRIIANFNPYMVQMADRLNKGDLSVLAEGDLIGFAAMDYRVHNYNNAAALVVEAKGHIFHGGGGNTYLIVYYDCDTGNIMTPRQYLKKCGISEQELMEICSAQRYAPSFPDYGAVKTAYDVKFAVNQDGKVILYTEFGD